MRILVLGASGMLGHKLVQVIGAELETVAAVRDNASIPAGIGAAEVVAGVDAGDLDSVGRLLHRVRPDAVLNAVGVIKQEVAGAGRSQTIAVNALFPHQLAELCAARKARLVHFATDCVFSGERESIRGPQGYRETDPADARDVYGLSKLLGEPESPSTLVIRTSMIGRELKGQAGLVEWFLSQDQPVRGFTNALFTGLPTLELARVTLRIVTDHGSLSGVWHVAGQSISKHDLLGLVKQAYGRPTEIIPDDTFYCDRRLDGSRFVQATQWHPPDWPTLVAQMKQDPFVYEDWRRPGSVCKLLKEA